MSDQIEWVFFLKNVFNPNEPLSRWIIKLAIARNDLFHIHRRLDIESEMPLQPGERFYIFRLGVSHLREALKLVDCFKDEIDIKKFIKKLSPKNQEAYSALIKLNNDFHQPNSVIKSILKPIRDNSFHYYESEKGKRSQKYESQLINDLKSMDNLSTRFIKKGAKRKDIEYTFAEEISFHLLFGISPDEEVTRLGIKTLSLLVSSFIGFSDDAVLCYLASKQNNMLKVSTKNKVLD